MDIPETLLRLAGAVAPDGGRAVGRALRAVLEEVAPFDAAEAVLGRPGGWTHSRLDDGDEEIAGEDLLGRLAGLRAPLRLDDLPEAAAFPETERRLGALGLRSLLAIPFAAGAASPRGRAGTGSVAPEGAIVLARRFGWAFAGTSLHYLWPVAGMAGRVFELSIALTALTDRNERLEHDLERLRASPEARDAAREGLLHELAEARREALELRSVTEELRAAQAQAASHALDLEGVLGQTAAERDGLRSDLGRTTEELVAERRGVEDARAQLAGAQAKVAELEGGLGDSHARIEKLRQELAQVREQSQSLQGQLAALLSEVEAAREQIESRRHDAASASSELEAVRAALDLALKDLEALRTERQTLLEEEQAARRAVEGEAEELRRELDRRVEEAEAQREERDRALELAASTERARAAHVRTLAQELAAAHEAAYDKGAALREAEERCRELEARLANWGAPTSGGAATAARARRGR